MAINSEAEAMGVATELLLARFDGMLAALELAVGCAKRTEELGPCPGARGAMTALRLALMMAHRNIQTMRDAAARPESAQSYHA